MGCLKQDQLLFITDDLSRFSDIQTARQLFFTWPLILPTLFHSLLFKCKIFLSRFLFQFIFPVQLTLGLFGNSLILWVLTSDEVQNVASDMLAAVAFCDLAFLLSMFPYSLSSFEDLAYNYHFRLLYLRTKQHLAAIANWMSAAAIWLILAVSIERFLIIRSPLRSKLYWHRGKMVLVLSSIFFTTGVLTAYHHFEYDCEIEAFCNATQLYQFCYYAGEKHKKTIFSIEEIAPSDIKRMYMRASTIINAVAVVFIPIVAVILINVLMIREIKLNDTMQQCRRASRRWIRQRQRVTITVIAIGLCFALSQGPSAVMVICEIFFIGYSHPNTNFYQIFSITNSLVITGKTVNFILFCLSSEHFRRKCFVLLYRRFPKLSHSKLAQRVDRRSNSHETKGSIRTQRSYRRSSMIEQETPERVHLSTQIS